MTNFIAILFLAAIPAFLSAASDLLTQQALLIASVVAALSLLWVWGRSPDIRFGFLHSWRFWLIVGSISTSFSLMAVVRLLLSGQLNFQSVLISVQGLIAGVLSFVGQVYYYARHLYGHRNPVFGSVDPIGMGIPVHVQMAGEADSIRILGGMGIAAVKPNLTDHVILIDETDSHYIIGVQEDGTVRVMKVVKQLVKAILYSK